MDFFAVLQRMIELFLIIVIGYGVRMLGVINTEGRGVLSKLVLNISLPATILSAVMNASALPESSELFMIIFVAVLSYVVLFAFAKSGICDVFALVIPLAFTRPILTVTEFFRKPGEKKV